MQIPRLGRLFASDNIRPANVSGLADFFEASDAFRKSGIPKPRRFGSMKDTADITSMQEDVLTPINELIRPRTEAETLLLRMRISQKCRYNASVRLRRSYRFRLFTSMMFAVGLMIIPLLQNSPITLGFSPAVMAMVQVLLAVGILVFTVIAGKAGFELRADKLNQEGDSLKDLSRRLTRYMAAGSEVRLEEFHQEYAALTSGKEAHSRSDYLQAQLEMKEYFPMWPGKRLALRVGLGISVLSNYVIPLLLILMEMAFVSDMLTLTTLYPNVLHLPGLAR